MSRRSEHDNGDCDGGSGLLGWVAEAMADATLRARFWAKVDKSDGCWLWRGKLSAGYGRFTIDRRNIYAHRLSYELARGPIPTGLVLDHLCRNPACVNPDHLEPVTSGANVLRGVGLSAQRARQTHCKRGHEFNEENTRHDTRGRRVCKPCQQAYKTKWNTDHRGAMAAVVRVRELVAEREEWLREDHANDKPDPGVVHEALIGTTEILRALDGA